MTESIEEAVLSGDGGRVRRAVAEFQRRRERTGLVMFSVVMGLVIGGIVLAQWTLP